MTYRVRYVDLSYRDYEDGQPPDEPWNVAIVIHATKDGEWLTRSQGDFYIHENGEWIGVDLMGLVQWAVETGQVMVGRMMGGQSWVEVMELATKDKQELSRK